MKKYFLPIIITIILIIFGLQFFYFFFSSKRDVNTYVTLLSGQGYKNENMLSLGQKQKAKENDIIKTNGKDSVIIVNWGDGSVTRIGGDSSIVIQENKVSEDLREIQIKFELEKGKSWSKVTSFIGKDSYFSQGFDELEAGVRGTTYEINLEEDTIFVENHELQLLQKNSGDVYIIPEKQPFSISNFGFYEIKEYIYRQSVNLWHKLNIEQDIDYVKILDEEFSKQAYGNSISRTISDIFFPKYRFKLALMHRESLKEIEDRFYQLTDSQKKGVTKYLETAYQEVYFSTPGDKTFTRKFMYRKLLMNTPDYTEMEALVRSIFFDLQDITTSTSESAEILLKELQSIDYKKYIPEEQIAHYFQIIKNIPIQSFPETVKNEFLKLRNLFEVQFPQIIEKTTLELKNKGIKLKNDIEKDITVIINNFQK